MPPAGDLSPSGFTPIGASVIALTPALLEQRGDRGQYVIQDRRRQRVHLASIAGVQIERARLIAPHDAGCLDAADWNRETDAPGEVAAVGYR